MIINDIIELKVEKLVYEGSALCRYGEDGFVIFVSNALPDEVLKVKIVSINKKFARGEIIEIIKPSKHRIKPFCALYNACGSCQLQITDYNYSIELKNSILKEIFCEYKLKPFIKSPSDKQYRHKIQYPCRQTKNSKRILMGYFKNNSHDLTNIKFCPLQPQLSNDIAQFIRENYKLDCYSEKNHKGLLKNVVMRLTTIHNANLVFVLNIEEVKFKKYEEYFISFSKEIAKNFKEIKGIFANFNPSKTNKILSNSTKKLFGEDYIEEKIGNKTYKLGATSFFQVNPGACELLFNAVKKEIKPNSTVLDAYGGVGAIGIYVNASNTTLIEENLEATKIARLNYELNSIKNYQILEGDAKKQFENINKTFDYVILDPPRSGCDREVLNKISKISKNIVYVSCNPQTLKRDILYLKEEGYKVKSIQGFDLFPYTYHIETIAILEKF